MSLRVCTPARALVVLAILVSTLIHREAFAQTTPTFKVAWFNIQSGKGEPAMAGHQSHFVDTTNCTDPSQPMNGWATGLVQAHLTNSVGADPKVVALGLAEAWASTCGSPEHVRAVLGWKSATSENNGVAMVAKYGFAGPEEWLQLDTTLNPNPADTMWVLRIPVCLDAACSQTMNMFASHWYASGANKSDKLRPAGQPGGRVSAARRGNGAAHPDRRSQHLGRNVAGVRREPDQRRPAESARCRIR